MRRARARVLGAPAFATALAFLVTFALLMHAVPAGASTPVPGAGARAATLIEAGSGEQLYGRSPNSREAIASATKLMTALVTLEHVHRLGVMFTQNGYRSAAEDSQIGLAPGERMSVHDLLIALMLPSADDAAEDLAFNVGHGSVARFVGMMNARARRLGLVHTHYSTPIGLDTPGNYSSASDLVMLARYLLRTSPFFKRVVGLKSAVLHTGQPRADSRQPQRPRGQGPMDQRRQDRPHAPGRVRPGRLGTRDGMTLISAVIGTPDEAVRDASTLSLLNYGFANYALRTPVRKGQVLARPPVQRSRPAARGGDRGRHVPARVRAHRPAASAGQRARAAGRAARAPRARRLGGGSLARQSRQAGAARGRAGLCRDQARRAASGSSTRPFTLVSLLVIARRGHRFGRVLARSDQGKTREARMIITVTLNAALDKTLEVPNFTPGRRHRTVDQTTMPGGKGVNVARALKRLGQPVIATGFAGGATGTRIVQALNDEAILNGFTPIREESRTNTAVLDPTTNEHTEINERGPVDLPPGARAVPRQAAVSRQGRQHVRVRRAACPAASTTTCTPG